MSDNFIRIIPLDPTWIPAAGTQEAMREYVAELFPHAEEIDLVSDEGIQFRDCGSNLELVTCPACQREIPIDQWQDMMDDDYSDVTKEYLLEPFALPCCGAKHTLNELRYTFDQGFSRFEINVMNPQVKAIRPSEVRELSEGIGCPIKVVFQHV